MEEGAASPPSEPRDTTRGIRICRVLYLFSGAQRKASVASFLQEESSRSAIQFELHEIDIQNSPDWDLTDKALQGRLLQDMARGHYHVVLITPPCSTWSRVRGANCRGPPMIRSQAYPWGFPWLSKRHQKDAELGNVLIHFMIEVLQALEGHPRTEDGSLVLVFGEHPEDLGTIWREEDRMQMHPASIWQLPQLRDFVRADNPLQLFTVVFNQFCWSAPYRKPTRLITNLLSLKKWGPNTWPVFHHDGTYKGPAQDLCSCTPTVSLARTAADDTFRTTATSIYPEPMDRAIAQAILLSFHATPPQAKEGPTKGEWTKKRSREKEECGAEGASSSKALCKSDAGTALNRETVGSATLSKSRAGTTLSNATLSNATLSNTVNCTTLNGAGGGASSPSAPRPGLGPPMQTKYKGELRSIHDGAGLCSPGRWPVERRTAPASETGKELARWCLRAFEDWVELEGEEKAKDLFWRTAGGKLGGTPFGGEIYGFRESWTSG